MVNEKTAFESVPENEKQTYYHGVGAVGRKLAFASGELVYNLPWMLVSSFLAFFMTDVALIPAGGQFPFCSWYVVFGTLSTTR